MQLLVETLCEIVLGLTDDTGSAEEDERDSN